MKLTSKQWQQLEQITANNTQLRAKLIEKIGFWSGTPAFLLNKWDASEFGEVGHRSFKSKYYGESNYHISVEKMNARFELLKARDTGIDHTIYYHWYHDHVYDLGLRADLEQLYKLRLKIDDDNDTLNEDFVNREISEFIETNDMLKTVLNDRGL